MTSPDSISFAKHRLSRSNPVPFSYDHTSRAFSFGSQLVAPHDIPAQGVPYGVRNAQLSDEAIDEMFATEPVIHTNRTPLSLPLFQDYIRDNWTNALADETMQVMADLMPRQLMVNQSLSLRRAGYRAIRACGSSDNQAGRMQLEVPGSCACLGPDATMPSWGSQFWNEGIMAYSYHNIDNPTQRVALMAGLGHVGYRAREWANGRGA